MIAVNWWLTEKVSRKCASIENKIGVHVYYLAVCMLLGAKRRIKCDVNVNLLSVDLHFVIEIETKCCMHNKICEWTTMSPVTEILQIYSSEKKLFSLQPHLTYLSLSHTYSFSQCAVCVFDENDTGHILWKLCEYLPWKMVVESGRQRSNDIPANF